MEKVRRDKVKNLYTLQLYEVEYVETITSDLATSVMRVPGGWIFRSYDKSRNMMSSVFVPYSNEFAE